jgi:MSHA biogenesis protein MshO
MARPSPQRGFTLIEVVMVIVLIGIIAGIMAPFITQSIDAYTATRSRTELVAKGRLALERISREVRQAVPNSLEAVGTGIQFLTTRAGGRLVAIDDDFGSAFAVPSRRFTKGVNRTRLYSVGTGLAPQANDFLVIGNTSPADLKSGSTIISLAGIGAAALVPDGTANGQILQFANHTFSNDSPGRHFQIADAVHEICRNGNTLNWRRTAGFAGYDNACAATAGDPVLVDGVAASTFAYHPGTPQSSGVLRMELQLSEGAETITLYHEVQMRNTP